MAFTLSQSGMVLHWWREHSRHWQIKAVANGVGALATGTTLLIVAVSKFTQGAWITILLIPAMVFGFLQVRAHYRTVATQLSLRGLPPSLRPFPPQRLVIPISGVHRAMIDAVTFALSISKDVTAVYIELEPGAGQRMKLQWDQWWPGVPLVILPSPYRSIVQPLLEFLDETDREHHDGQLAAVVLPEFVPAHWWQAFLHNQSARLIKHALLYNRRQLGFQRVIIDVPYHLKR